MIHYIDNLNCEIDFQNEYLINKISIAVENNLNSLILNLHKIDILLHI